MAFDRTPELKRARLAADVSELGSASILELGDVGMANVICRFQLANPVGTISGTTLTFTGFPALASALITGDIAAARVKTSVSGVEKYTGITVGLTPASDIVLDATSVVAGQNVRITSFTVTD